MSIAKYIKEIGRGKEGARSLSRAQAYDLMVQVLAGTVSDLELGAFVMSMRIKGESPDEIEGFLDAVHQACIPLESTLPVIVLPSYNGSRRLPNLTPLLALLLAQEGMRVLVHGPAHDPVRVTSVQLFRGLGLHFARNVDELHTAWARREPAFVRIDDLCPPLARLLDVRWTVGLRNSGHTVAKLMDPLRDSPTLRVMNYTHPEYAELLSQVVQRLGANAMVMRGTEGEPVADPRRTPRLDTYIAGTLRPDLSPAAQEGVLTELPVLPRDHDPAATAVYIQSVVSGEKPAPAPLLQQVDALRRAHACLVPVSPALEKIA
jgi:anthranilate phosphoribosyltransferase